MRPAPGYWKGDGWWASRIPKSLSKPGRTEFHLRIGPSEEGWVVIYFPKLGFQGWDDVTPVTGYFSGTLADTEEVLPRMVDELRAVSVESTLTAPHPTDLIISAAHRVRELQIRHRLRMDRLRHEAANQEFIDVTHPRTKR